MSSSDDLLNSLLQPTPWPTAPRSGIQKIGYSHDAMIDQIIANPGIHQNQLAAIFGYSPSWISTVIASDTFQARYAERRKELVDPGVLEAVENQFKGLVRRSLEILMEKLDKPANDIPDQLALRAFEIASRAAGYGAKESSVTITHTEVNNNLEVHGDQLVELLRRKKAQVNSEEILHDPSNH